MKAYKILENSDSDGLIKPGRILIRFEDEFKMARTLLAATPILPQVFWDNSTLNRLLEKGYLEEIDILKEKWLHYHLYRPIKNFVAEALNIRIS